MSISTVLQHFTRQVAARPHALAVVQGDDHLTYQDLDLRSRRVGSFLVARGIGKGCIVPVYADRSIELLIALLGVLRAGAAYSPIDGKHPEERKAYVARQCGAALSLSTRPGMIDESAQRVEVIDSILARGEPFDHAGVEVTGHDPVYVIFTSGTTGAPKGVVVEHHPLARLVTWHNDQFDMGASSRTTWMAGIGFDVSQWEIWSTLVAGACLFLLDEETRLDPRALLSFYARHGITHAFVPTVRVPEVVGEQQPADLSLQYLFTCGEKLGPVDLDHLRYPLVDYYGPTEATIFATVHRVPSRTLNRPSSIGLPITDTEVFILGEDGSGRGVGEVGEIHLAGSCLARGYLHDEVLTAEKFVCLPGIPGKRLYRTGDLGRWLPDGTIQFLGRIDDQVKIRGNRVELGEVEAALMDDPEVRAVAALVDEGASPADRKILAFVVPREKRLTGSRSGPLIDRLKDRLSHRLPDYMWPSHYHCIDAMPCTPNGKKDKVVLREMHRAALRLPQRPAETTGGYEAEIARIWGGLLGHRQFGVADSFFEVGGHSLLATSLTREISRRLGVRAWVRDIYEHKSIQHLAREMERRRNQAAPLLDREPIRELRDDVRLPEGFAVTGGFTAEQLVAPGHILLTGATGFVGVHLLAELLARTGAQVHCLVRGRDPAAAARRVDETLARYQVVIPPAARARIHVYAGDLAEEHLGLSGDAYAVLAGRVDIVYHAASAVNFIQPYSYMKRDNVEGLRELLRFAAEKRVKPLTLLSTISVYSWGHLHTGKTRMWEDDDIDQNLPAVITDIGYVRSKWVMEKIADLAAAHGLPLMVFRLGYATFHSRTGLCHDSQWWVRLVRTCLAQGSIPDLRNLREGLTTVDHMAAAIAVISRNPEALGKKFNLIPPAERNLTLKGFFALLGDSLGVEFQVLPFRDWVARWESDREAPLYPLLNMFRDNMYNGMSTVELYQDTYLWDCRNVRRFLAGSGVSEPVFTAEKLRNYVERSVGWAVPVPRRAPARRVDSVARQGTVRVGVTALGLPPAIDDDPLFDSTQ
jgi:amino acid adenylation domain-containing protein/thioester reductase-like protein